MSEKIVNSPCVDLDNLSEIDIVIMGKEGTDTEHFVGVVKGS